MPTLRRNPDRTEKIEAIAESVSVTPGETVDALRELRPRRAAESFAGRSILV